MDQFQSYTLSGVGPGGGERKRKQSCRTGARMPSAGDAPVADRTASRTAERGVTTPADRNRSRQHEIETVQGIEGHRRPPGGRRPAKAASRHALDRSIAAADLLPEKGGVDFGKDEGRTGRAQTGLERPDFAAAFVQLPGDEDGKALDGLAAGAGVFRGPGLAGLGVRGGPPDGVLVGLGRARCGARRPIDDDMGVEQGHVAHRTVRGRPFVCRRRSPLVLERKYRRAGSYAPTGSCHWPVALPSAPSIPALDKNGQRPLRGSHLVRRTSFAGCRTCPGCVDEAAGCKARRLGVTSTHPKDRPPSSFRPRAA